MKRRDFLSSSVLAIASGAAMRSPVAFSDSPPPNRPNFLWLSAEDISPDLGCYGDPYAVSPNIDRFAREGTRYTRAFSHSGVCAPSRSGIITGMYPTTIGTHHMRCKGVPPPSVKCFSEYLRAAGYYCTNNTKTDYQFDSPFTAWDENSRRAHWRNRAPDQPFFSVFNFGISHESQIRNRSKGMRDRIAALAPHEKHDPSKAVLPPYYPDTPKVREDWAQYHDVITLMDREVGEVLAQLEADGLAEDTIVWFWGDHGRGLPRAKRWIYDSGLQFPLIVRVPEKWRHLAFGSAPVAPGSANGDLVAFVDFAPTMLSLAGLSLPEHFQGQAFLGPSKAPPRRYVYAARDRMDEAYDLIRAVRDVRYKYIRNYMAHVSYGQDIDYMNEMPTMQEMRRLNAAGELTGAEKQYFQETKPLEELYDTETDPHEVNNLAADPDYAEILDRLRNEHRKWTRETGDVGLIPEPAFDAMKWPSGKPDKTDNPFAWRLGGAGAPVHVECTTRGASIGYRAKGETDWRLYTAPIVLQTEAIEVKACRIGFEDSEVVEVMNPGPPLATHPPSDDPIVHWREAVDATGVLEALWDLRSLDGAGARAIAAYGEGLTSPYAPVRYWCVVGLHVHAPDREAAREAARPLLEDDAASVRVAAAQALCDWGDAEEALPVLVEALSHPLDSARLFAVTALGRIGEAARPALPALRRAMEDPYQDVVKVTKYTLARLDRTASEVTPVP